MDDSAGASLEPLSVEKRKYPWESKEWVDVDDIFDDLGIIDWRASVRMTGFVFLPCFACALLLYSTVWMVYIPPDVKCVASRNSSVLHADQYISHVAKRCSVLYNVTNNVTGSYVDIEHQCANAWIFTDTLKIIRSFAMENNFVCEKNAYPTIIITVQQCGVTIGQFLYGYLNDRLGRRVSFMICFVNFFVFGLLGNAISNITIWIIVRGVYGLALVGIFQIPFVTILEYIPKSYRARLGLFTFLVFDIGYCTLALIVYIVEDWRTLNIVTILPFAVFLFYWNLLPESPRWLLTNLKYSEFNKVCKRIANSNNVTLDADLVPKIKLINEKGKANQLKLQTTYLDLFAFKHIGLQTVICTFIWSVCAFVFVGFILSCPQLHPNPVIAFFLVSFIDFFAYGTMMLIIGVIGRKGCLFLGLLSTSVASLVLTMVDPSRITARLILALLSKASATLAFATIYIAVQELFPTVIRAKAIGFIGFCACIPVTAVPTMIYFAQVNSALTFQVFALLGFVAAMCSTLLPETTNVALPETIKEVESFGAATGLLKRLCFFRASFRRH